LNELGVSVVAASTDDEEKAAEVAADLSYPVAYGVSREQADSLGAWWEDRRGIIQPSEFLLDAEHKVMTSTYSAGPIGRIEPADLVKIATMYEKRRKEG